MKEISLWGAESTGNTLREFQLQFATGAEGQGIFGDSIRYMPRFSMTYQATFRQSFPFQQYVKARYVRLEAISNFYGNFSLSGGDKVGLGEIAFQSNFDNLECAGSIGKQITDTDSPNEIFV